MDLTSRCGGSSSELELSSDDESLLEVPPDELPEDDDESLEDEELELLDESSEDDESLELLEDESSDDDESSEELDEELDAGRLRFLLCFSRLSLASASSGLSSGSSWPGSR